MPYASTVSSPANGQRHADVSQTPPGNRRSGRSNPKTKPDARADAKPAAAPAPDPVIPQWAKGKGRPVIRVPVSSPAPIPSPYTAKHTTWRRDVPFVPATPVPVPIPAPEALDDDRDDFAASVARLLRNKTTYEPEDMLDENGNRKSLNQLLEMAKYAPIWSMLSSSEREAVNYTAGVLKNDMGFIVRKAARNDLVRKVRPVVITIRGPVEL
jgi:hypothetical protein